MTNPAYVIIGVRVRDADLVGTVLKTYQPVFRR